MSYSSKSQPLTVETHSPFRSAFTVKAPVTLACPVSSVTKQEFRDECDINTIMAQYQRTGELPVLNQRSPQFLDVSASGDFQSAMNFVAEAKTLFMELPSSIRTRFGNDAAQFLDFCGQEKNRAEMHEMGLLKPEIEWTVPVTAIPPSAAPVAAPVVETE